MQQFQQRIYKDYEIKIFPTETGYKLQVFKGEKAYHPVVSIDYDTNADMATFQGQSGIEILVTFLQSQIDDNMLLEQLTNS